MVHALLDVKADVNGKELKGAHNGPLHAAYDRGDQEIVKVRISCMQLFLQMDKSCLAVGD